MYDGHVTKWWCAIALVALMGCGKTRDGRDSGGGSPADAGAEQVADARPPDVNAEHTADAVVVDASAEHAVDAAVDEPVDTASDAAAHDTTGPDVVMHPDA